MEAPHCYFLWQLVKEHFTITKSRGMDELSADCVQYLRTANLHDPDPGNWSTDVVDAWDEISVLIREGLNGWDRRLSWAETMILKAKINSSMHETTFSLAKEAFFDFLDKASSSERRKYLIFAAMNRLDATIFSVKAKGPEFAEFYTEEVIEKLEQCQEQETRSKQAELIERQQEKSPPAPHQRGEAARAHNITMTHEMDKLTAQCVDYLRFDTLPDPTDLDWEETVGGVRREIERKVLRGANDWNGDLSWTQSMLLKKRISKSLNEAANDQGTFSLAQWAFFKVLDRPFKSDIQIHLLLTRRQRLEQTIFSMTSEKYPDRAQDYAEEIIEDFEELERNRPEDIVRVANCFVEAQC